MKPTCTECADPAWHAASAAATSADFTYALDREGDPDCAYDFLDLHISVVGHGAPPVPTTFHEPGEPGEPPEWEVTAVRWIDGVPEVLPPEAQEVKDALDTAHEEAIDTMVERWLEDADIYD